MFYRIARFVTGIYMWVVFRIRVTGTEYLPDSGAMIVCSNHASNYDPVILAVCVKRTLHFLGKKELYVNPFLIKVLKWLQTIPVDRSKADLQSYKEVMKVLKKGEAVGIFVQGTRKAAQADGKGGAAMFALKSGATIVPAGISASYKPFSKITVRFGEPLDLQPYQNQKVNTELINQVTTQIMDRIGSLCKEV